MRAAPNDAAANQMRAVVLTGQCRAWEAGPRSAAELKEASVHWDRAAAIDPAPTVKAEYARRAVACRSLCRRNAV